MKNHVARDAIARSTEDPGFSVKRRQGGGVRLKKGSVFTLRWMYPVLLMLGLVQVPKSCWCEPGISPEKLRVDLSCLGLFSVRWLIFSPSGRMLQRLYLSTVLGVGQALLFGGMRAEGLRGTEDLGSSSGRRHSKKRPKGILVT